MITTKTILRLVAIRSFAPVTLTDVDTLTAEFVTLAQSLRDGMFLMVDLRPCGIVPQEVAHRITELQRRENPALIRAAYLVSQEQGGLGLQLSRMLRSAASPLRRDFDNEGEAALWLGESMVGNERRALAAFLKEGSTMRVRAMGKPT